MPHFLTISTSSELIRIPSDSIVYFVSDGNYCNIRQRNEVIRMVSFNLKQIENMISEQLEEDAKDFGRLGKQHIINKRFVNYINPQRQKLELSDGATFSFMLSLSKEALQTLKYELEKEEV